MTTYRSARATLVGALAVSLAAALGCAKRLVKAPPGALETAPSRLAEPTIRGGRFAAAPLLKTARFELDRYDLGTRARDRLKQNADLIKSNPAWEVLIEGHCDERGTIGYNLALGQRRARAVRDYYLLLGIAGDRVATISHGEEKGSCHESTAACWARNRRAEHKLKVDVVGSAVP